ncbi:hypothetical protein NSPZN2_30061 [Nitrospira defluvii]|uniref:Secreted protein n=1 Tax=Nitrospira defluvii TaxID=330214 RepID=A0ABM8REI3_9BACT|nr:hypothetical protein NSPZN2_30061 [Nitrospira defluvii]
MLLSPNRPATVVVAMFFVSDGAVSCGGLVCRGKLVTAADDRRRAYQQNPQLVAALRETARCRLMAIKILIL